jgi:hypothetical protein
MEHKRTRPWLLVAGAVMLMLLLSVACEPSFPTAADPYPTPARRYAHAEDAPGDADAARA